MSKLRGSWRCLLALGCSCVATDDPNDSVVDRARVVGVVFTPAELAPGEVVHLRAVVASPDGPLAPTLRWAFCTTPRAPSENTAVSASCAGGLTLPFGAGELELDAVVPRDACARFGSETPAGRAGNRADTTGGYYQPVRVALEEEITVARVRIRCALPSAPIAEARSYATDYRTNVAPGITNLRAFVNGSEVDLAALPGTTELLLQLEVPSDAHEPYLFYEVRSGLLSTQAERLSATWFTSRGSFVVSATDVSADGVGNVLRTTVGDLRDTWVWVVLRDDRGGSSVAVRTLHFVSPSPSGGGTGARSRSAASDRASGRPHL